MTRLPSFPAWFRFHHHDRVHLGLFDPDGARFLDAGERDVMAMLAHGQLRLAHLQELMAAAQPMAEPPHYAVPVQPGKILCMAKNYAAHAREFGAEPPPEPVFFAKLPDTLLPHGQPVLLPHFLDSRIDHEAELALVLGFAAPAPGQGGARYVTAEHAMRLVAGYTCLNDVTARKLQGTDRDQKYPWLRSKSFDTFCPTGPFVVPVDAIDASDLQISMLVNGEVRQQSSTAAMLHDPGHTLAAMARFCTLRPGDLIATGTPEGVGPIQHGDQMVVRIAGLGELRNPVQREAPPAS